MLIVFVIAVSLFVPVFLLKAASNAFRKQWGYKLKKFNN